MTPSQQGGVCGVAEAQEEQKEQAAGRIFGLDLLRALAIGGVLVSHLQLVFWGGRSALAGVLGTLGVELFFVLSGFLIGGLLLDILEQGAGPRALWTFLVRRWMRTIPLYYLWLGVLLLCGTWAGATRWPWFFMSFTQNLAWPMTSVWYDVSWSLMVEEWFYLLFASLLFALAGVMRASRALGIACALFIVLPLLARWLADDPLVVDWDAQIRKVVLLHLDAIAYGVAMAWLMRSRRRACDALALPMLALGLALVAASLLSSLDPASYRSATWRAGFFSLASTGFALCFPAVVRLRQPGWVLDAAVRWTSQRSYGMYIVHLSVMEFARRLVLDGTLQPREGLLLAGLGTAALAELSYRLVEVPLLVRRPPQHARGEGGHRNRRGMRVIAS